MTPSSLPLEGHVYLAGPNTLPAWLVGRRVLVYHFDGEVCVKVLARGRVVEEEVARWDPGSPCLILPPAPTAKV